MAQFCARGGGGPTCVIEVEGLRGHAVEREHAARDAGGDDEPTEQERDENLQLDVGLHLQEPDLGQWQG